MVGIPLTRTLLDRALCRTAKIVSFEPAVWSDLSGLCFYQFPNEDRASKEGQLHI
jgi:hypothetical protein